MNAVPLSQADPSPRSEQARRRMRAAPQDLVTLVDWPDLLFFHYAIAPELVSSALPPAFELELRESQAVLSLAAVTMRNFRRHPMAPSWTRLLPLPREQRFLNLRVYGRVRGESGVLFLWGWLSRPFGLPWPDRPFGLTSAFARIAFPRPDDALPTPSWRGSVEARGGRFQFRLRCEDRLKAEPCPAGSLEEFAMERYTGFFVHRGRVQAFRAWHPPFLQASAVASIEDDGLVRDRFPWFANARLTAATYAPGFRGVWLARPRDAARRVPARKPRAASLFMLP